MLILAIAETEGGISGLRCFPEAGGRVRVNVRRSKLSCVPSEQGPTEPHTERSLIRGCVSYILKLVGLIWA